MLYFHLITLFPEVCRTYLDSSILGRAIASGKIEVKYYDPRSYVKAGERVDAKPYGGGPGMVLRSEPVLKAISRARGRKRSVEMCYFSPGGREFTNQQARELAGSARHLILVLDRYEGLDARVKTIYPGREFSVGSFVLTGGELPGLAVIDAVARQVPGVLGDQNSIEENRVASRQVYTRPAELKYRGEIYKVPEILRSGHHRLIDDWRADN